MKMLHVTIQTAKFEEELKFYQEQVGLVIQRDAREMGRDMVFLADAPEETNIEIIGKPDAEDSGNPNISIGFKTDDLEKKREELIAAGFEPTPMIAPMPNIKFFFVKDPAGVNVQFM